MHNTKTKNPIHLLHRTNGIIRTFKSFDEAARFWPWINNLKGTIGKEFKIEYSEKVRLKLLWRTPPVIYNTYVLRDSFGDTIDPQNIINRYNELFPCRRIYCTDVNMRQPGRKRTYPHCFGLRRPQTTYERRWADAWKDEEESPKIRARRNAHNLPNAWDDIPRRDLGNHNWKKFRKYQYKTE